MDCVSQTDRSRSEASTAPAVQIQQAMAPVKGVRGAYYLMRMLIFLLVPVLVVLVACNGNTPGQNQTRRAPYEGVPEGKPPGLGNPVPDPREELQARPAGQLPDFLSKLDGTARERTAALYQGAATHYDAFSHIPCYCGCALYTTAHTSLADCFVKEVRSDGQIVFTDHSLTCDLCQQAAQMTVDGLAQGKAVRDIRAEVHARLNYTGIWTDTPAP